MYSGIASSIESSNSNVKSINSNVKNIKFDSVWNSMASESLLNKLSSSVSSLESCSSDLSRYASLLYRVDEYIALLGEIKKLQAQLSGLPDDEEYDAQRASLTQQILELQKKAKQLKAELVSECGSFTGVSTTTDTLVNDVSLDKTADTTKTNINRETLRKQTKAENWDGPVLDENSGGIQGPTNRETYYNQPMEKVVEYMGQYGYTADDYWVRDDGVKMLGDYVIVATNLDNYSKGDIVETSLGLGIVADKCGECYNGDPAWENNFDIATAWKDVWLHAGTWQKDWYNMYPDVREAWDKGELVDMDYYTRLYGG